MRLAAVTAMLQRRPSVLLLLACAGCALPVEEVRPSAPARHEGEAEAALTDREERHEPRDPCFEPWILDATGKVLSAPAECARPERDRGDPPPERLGLELELQAAPR